MESELFGHEKGSFTGAVQQKIGKFEQANHGTLFLDEVGNLSIETQAKLLHFLQDFKITRVGGERSISLDLRVIAATNVPLETLVKNGAFREDLYYRLFVVVMDIPQLSERKEDLPELSNYFLGIFNDSMRKNIRSISPQAMKKVYAYHWPGNIRELRNAIQQAVLFCEGEEITEDLIVLNPVIGSDTVQPVPQQVDEISFKKSQYHLLSQMSEDRLKELLGKHHGNIVRVAREIGVSRRALYYHFKKKGIDVASYR
jgi:DNA-binding NtrC family response regulator